MAWNGVLGHRERRRGLHFVVVSKQGVRGVPLAPRMKITYLERPGLRVPDLVV